MEEKRETTRKETGGHLSWGSGQRPGDGLHTGEGEAAVKMRGGTGEDMKETGDRENEHTAEKEQSLDSSLPPSPVQSVTSFPSARRVRATASVPAGPSVSVGGSKSRQQGNPVISPTCTET